MFHKDFLFIKRWLVDKRYVVFYLEHPFLGRPGDNQFEFLDATFQEGQGIFSFSNDLQIEIVKPTNLHIHESYLEIRSIETLRISWREEIVELSEITLRIDE
jgi:hypothetical protein